MKLVNKIILIIALGLLLGILIAFPIANLHSHDLTDFNNCQVCILQTNLAAGSLLFALILFLFAPPGAAAFLLPREIPISSPFSGFQFLNKAPPIV